ncbi:MAG TPA: hypothetical protein VGM31_12855, partial [Puia sp.]
YIFGIFSQDGQPNAKAYSATMATSGTWNYEELKFKSFPDNLGQYLKSIGQDHAGDVYLLTSGQQGPSGATGKVFKLIAVH